MKGILNYITFNPRSSPTTDPHPTFPTPAHPSHSCVEPSDAPSAPSGSSDSPRSTHCCLSPFSALAHYLPAGGRGPPQLGPLQGPVGYAWLRGLPPRRCYTDQGGWADRGCGGGRRAGQIGALCGALRERIGRRGHHRLRSHRHAGHQRLSAQLFTHLHAQRCAGGAVGQRLPAGDGQKLALSLLHPHLTRHAPLSDSQARGRRRGSHLP